MNFFLLALSLTSVFNSLLAAPAVSSVHVTFVSGNKGTHYSHGSGDDGSIVQFNLLDKDDMGIGIGGHTVRKRSATQRSPGALPVGLELLKLRTNRRTSSSTSSSITTVTNTNTPPTVTSTTTDNSITIDSAPGKRITTARPNRGRKRVTFIQDDLKNKISNLFDKLPVKSSTTENGVKVSKKIQEQPTNTKEVEISTATSTTSSTTTSKLKDTKAVKRSPHFSDNFIGSFNFPDFDEFGGNDFGSLRDFGHGSGGHDGGGGGHDGGGHVNHASEGLAPDGVFLPPVPTQASNYVENDPYLAEPEVANYAVQHVPYFHEFPHKRTVLALNERREENGLEPNILRSIRPFFAFFEINNHQNTHGYHNTHGDHHGNHGPSHPPPTLLQPSPFLYYFPPEADLVDYHYLPSFYDIDEDFDRLFRKFHPPEYYYS